MKILLALFVLNVAFVFGQNNLCDVNFLTNGTFICAKNDTELSPELIIIPANSGRDVFTTPNDTSLFVTFSKDNLFGNWTHNSTEFFFRIDAGSGVGSTAAAEISYDFDGDGTFDRVEVYGIFATDASPGFETWHGSDNSTANVTGDFDNMKGGSIRLRIWQAFGDHDMVLLSGAPSNSSLLVSNISFPFEFGTCCDQIAEIESELKSLQDQVDRLSSKLLAVTRNCCSGNSTSTSGSTSTATISGTVVVTGTTVETTTDIGTATTA